MADPLRIRDPVHGYVSVTAVERALLDEPVTQRLRWVAQSGMSQLVFPEVRTSRFTHSLGAMHLASRFLTGALKNVASDEASVFVEDGLRRLVEGADPDVRIEDDVVERLQAQGLTASTAVPTSIAKHALLAEQAVRLAALFHDLGHLPFSHDFEYVLRDVIAREAPAEPALASLGGPGKPPHEQIGYAMAGLLQQSVYGALNHDPSLRDIVSPAFKLARRILFAGPSDLSSGSSEEALLGLLHALIDGEVDVDRTDYLLRDARAYGFEYVSFDLDRLADSLAIVAADGGLELVIRAQGQSAVESFLFARMRMYQWGVFHHKVVQVGAALRHVTDRMLSGVTQPEHPLHAFVSAVATLADRDGQAEAREHALRAWSEWDDIWWLTELRKVGERDPWLRMLLTRARGPRSLWKRASEFPLGQEGLEEINRRLPARGENDRQTAWDGLRGSVLVDHEVLLERTAFTPMRMSSRGDHESALRLLVRDDLIPLSVLSPVIAGLNRGWDSELQVFASAAESHDADLPTVIAQRVLDVLPER